MSTPRGHRLHQRGLSSAWVLVILATLGSLITYAVSVTGAAQADRAREVAASRARQAALAGIDWARFQIANGGAALCASPTSLAIPLTSGTIAVTVHCPETLHTEAGLPVHVHQLSAIACTPTSSGSCPDASAMGNYVQQQVIGIAQR